MQVQSYKQHLRYVPMYHFVLPLILSLCLAGSIFFWYARNFAIVAQDRAIRAEENLRHFALTGKLLDSRLTMSQIIALRFAADTEFLLLAEKAANENMKPREIKMAIVNWRADNHRA